MLALLVAVVAGEAGTIVDIPYKRVESRPENNAYCQARYPFCPLQTAFPTVEASDEIEVWALKAPIWEFKYGDRMAKINGFHDAVGFYNKRTGARRWRARARPDGGQD